MIVARTGVNKSNAENDDIVKMSFTHRIHSPFIEAGRGGVILLPTGKKLHCPVQEANMMLPVQLILFEVYFFLSKSYIFVPAHFKFRRLLLQLITLKIPTHHTW